MRFCHLPLLEEDVEVAVELLQLATLSVSPGTLLCWFIVLSLSLSLERVLSVNLILLPPKGALHQVLYQQRYISNVQLRPKNDDSATFLRHIGSPSHINILRKNPNLKEPSSRSMI